MSIKQDISGIEDIKILVDDFYARVRQDELLAPIFNFRLSTHWGPHLEKMYSFWNAALFGVKGYTGNPFMKHMTMALNEEHFSRWLGLFNQTVNDFFEGDVAEEAKKRALIMANMFQLRLKEVKENNTKPIF